MGVILRKKLNRGGVPLKFYEVGGGLKKFSVKTLRIITFFNKKANIYDRCRCEFC